jgi:hypothetical protein
VETGEKLQNQEGKKIDMIDHLREQYKRITDAFADKDVITSRAFQKLTVEQKGVFTDYSELTLMEQYRGLLRSENSVLKEIERKLEEFPIWTQFMKGIKGCGPTMAGVIISSMDPHKAPYPASFWKYAGLDVVIADGRGRGKYEAHLVDVEYTDGKGDLKKRKSITFNAFLKTKLVGVMADIFIKHRTPKYRDIYDEYKNRLINDPKHADKTDAHRHRMAMRYMIKRFLVDLHMKWRELEGLPVTEEYSVRKLGMHHRDPAKTAAAQVDPLEEAGLAVPPVF